MQSATRHVRRQFLGIAAILLIAAPVLAQPYSVPAHVIAGGGGTSIGGGYALSGTIGDAATGTMAAGPYTVGGGFWPTTAQAGDGIILLSGDLAFGGIAVNTTATRLLTIRNVGSGTLTVGSISYPAGFSGDWPGGAIDAGGFHAVTVTFAPTAAASYGTTVTVNGNQASGTNTIAISGTGLTRIISLSGDLSFGHIGVGLTATRTLTISNTGTGALTVSSISYPSGFSGSWTGAIPAGASQQLTITFAPVAPTTYVGTLTVNADATSGAPSIGVSGRTGIVVWRSGTSGQNIGWRMNGLTVSMSAFLPTIADTNWEARGVGDIDGDGNADLVWRNKVTGQDIGWLMNGLSVANSAFLPTIADTNWEMVGVGDFDGDGQADVLLRNKVTGQNIGWLMNGLTVVSSAFLSTIADPNWQVAGLGDLNGDGKADVVWRNKITGQDIGWIMNGLTVTSSALLPTIADTNWHIVGLGDLNGDGKADVLLRNSSSGQDIGWLMNGLSVLDSAFLPTIVDTNWEIQAIGDVNGDDRADVVLRNKVTGQNIVWLMNGLTVANSTFLPTIADTNWKIIGPR